MKNEKKKHHSKLILFGVGMALYGAYSMVCSIKDCLGSKLSCMMKKMKKCTCNQPECDCGCQDEDDE